MIKEINDHWNTGELEYLSGIGINFQIVVSDVSSIIERLKNHNIPLFKKYMGNRYECGKITFMGKQILVQDPDGYFLRFSELTELY